MKNLLSTALLILAFSGQSQPSNVSGCPYFKIESPGDPTQYLPLISITADVNIASSIAEVKLTQTFTNSFESAIEAVYIFPGSSEAAIHGLSMQIGDRTITAEIRENQRAIREYEKAKSAGKRASLLQQTRPNVFQMQVANIMPDDTIKVAISYSEFIENDQGTYQFVLPMTIGPRYAGENIHHEDKPVDPLYLPGYMSSSHPFDINLSLNSTVPIQRVTSGTHKINVDMLTSNHFQVSLNPGDRFHANKDFIFEYQVRGDNIQSGLLQHKTPQENFFALQIQPPKQVEISHVPPREYLFIIDVSGSMQGFPMETAKILLEDLLSELRPIDFFNIIQFEFGSNQLFRESVRATESNINKAIRFTRTRNGFGGTNLDNALNNVYRIDQTRDLSRSTIIITDGQIEAERKVFKRIRDNLHISNVFAFGIGTSVNRYLIEGIAEAGLGEAFMVTDPAFAKEKAKELAGYINRPALTNISIDYGQNKVFEVSPLNLPDLLSNRPLTIYGKFFDKLTDDITVTGQTGNGYFTQVIPKAESSSGYNPALVHLWARNRVKELVDFNHPSDGIKEAVKQLGLNYALLTDYTSFVAIDSEVASHSLRPVASIDQPLPVPGDYTRPEYVSQSYRTKLNATGAVSRATGSSDIDILLPVQSTLTGPHFLVRWTSQMTQGPYKVILENVYNEVVYEKETSDPYLWISVDELNLTNPFLFLLKVTSDNQSSNEVGIRLENGNEHLHPLFDTSIKYSVVEYIQAIRELWGQLYILDALTLSEIALMHYPNEQTLQELREEIYSRR